MCSLFALSISRSQITPKAPLLWSLLPFTTEMKNGLEASMSTTHFTTPSSECYCSYHTEHGGRILLHLLPFLCMLFVFCVGDQFTEILVHID